MILVIKGMRKVAANEVILSDGTLLCPGIVEITRGFVSKTYRLEEEEARTEWLGGSIEIRLEGNNLKAYKNNKPI